MLIQNIPCPNCGSAAQRHYIANSNLTKTQCSACDYLMVMCSQSGRVIEAYAPGIDARSFSRRCANNLPASDIPLYFYPIQTLEQWRSAV